MLPTHTIFIPLLCPKHPLIRYKAHAAYALITEEEIASFNIPLFLLLFMHVQAADKKPAFLTLFSSTHTSLHQQHPLQPSPSPTTARDGCLCDLAEYFINEK